MWFIHNNGHISPQLQGTPTGMISQQRGSSHHNSMAHRAGTLDVSFFISFWVRDSGCNRYVGIGTWRLENCDVNLEIYNRTLLWGLLRICQYRLHCNIFILLAILQVQLELEVWNSSNLILYWHNSIRCWEFANIVCSVTPSSCLQFHW